MQTYEGIASFDIILFLKALHTLPCMPAYDGFTHFCIL
jgi:hypothetical protein